MYLMSTPLDSLNAVEEPEEEDPHLVVALLRCWPAMA